MAVHHRIGTLEQSRQRILGMLIANIAEAKRGHSFKVWRFVVVKRLCGRLGRIRVLIS
jgi:hypothetical protein